MAKGARRPKSPFTGKLDLFFEAEFEIIRSKKSDLHTLRELSLTSLRSRLRESYLQTLAATYFVQLLNQVTEPETPVRKLNNLLSRALDHLEQTLPDMKTILHYEKQMAEALGIHDPDQPPAGNLKRVYHRLPKTRAELLRLIQ